LVMAIPSIFIGAAATATNFDKIFKEEQEEMGWTYPMKILNDRAHCDGVESDGYCPFSIVPVMFKYVCYPVIAYFGLGAVSASVMSSADSSLLSISTLLTLNVFLPIQKALGYKEDPKWTPRVLKMFICIIGVIATTMAVKLKSVYQLFHMSGDIVYALLFPQLTAAMYMPTYVNWFGSTLAFITGVLLRFLSGEPFLGMEAYIQWPGFISAEDHPSGEHKQMFMFRTVSMIIVFVVLLAGSQIFEFVQKRRGVDIRRGHDDWKKNIVKSDLTDSYGSSNTSDEDFVDSTKKMLPDSKYADA
jgi:Na+/proline symporter